MSKRQQTNYLFITLTLGLLSVLLLVSGTLAFSDHPRWRIPDQERIATLPKPETQEEHTPKEQKIVYNTVDNFLSETEKTNQPDSNFDIDTLNKKIDTAEESIQQSIQIAETASIEATIAVQDIYYPVSIPKETTVESAMAFLAETTSFRYKTQDYGSDLGLFVTEINGIPNDARNGTFWVYLINGNKANTGISNYIIQSDDIILWRYEHSY